MDQELRPAIGVRRETSDGTIPALRPGHKVSAVRVALAGRRRAAKRYPR